MKRFRHWILSTVLMMLVGCHGEKSEVVTYLKQLEASNHRLELISKDYQQVISTVSEESVAGSVDQNAASERLRVIVARMKEEIAQVEGLPVPEKASGLHRAVLEQYRVLLQTVESTGPLVEILTRLSEANRRAAEDPGQAAGLAGEMKAVEQDRKEVAGRLDELMKKGRTYEEQARREQQQLQREFGISVKMDKE